MANRLNEGDYEKICDSGICSQLPMYQKQGGRKYIVRTWHKGKEREWCPSCISQEKSAEMTLQLVKIEIRNMLLAIINADDSIKELFVQADKWGVEI